MNPPTTSTRHALGQAIGLTAFVWGYPLVESLRTCRLQTLTGNGEHASWRSEIDQLQHVRRVSTDADRDVVTPANDLLYTTGWINLANGPRLLHVPAAARHPGRYFVLALYDAWTNNFDKMASLFAKANLRSGQIAALAPPSIELIGVIVLRRTVLFWTEGDQHGYDGCGRIFHFPIFSVSNLRSDAEDLTTA